MRWEPEHREGRMESWDAELRELECIAAEASDVTPPTRNGGDATDADASEAPRTDGHVSAPPDLEQLIFERIRANDDHVRALERVLRDAAVSPHTRAAARAREQAHAADGALRAWIELWLRHESLQHQTTRPAPSNGDDRSR